jgi:hypothetical protein
MKVLVILGHLKVWFTNNRYEFLACLVFQSSISIISIKVKCNDKSHTLNDLLDYLH